MLEELPADKVEASPVSPNNGQNSIPVEPDSITLLLRAFGKVDGGCVVFFPYHQKQLPPLLEKYGQQELVSAYEQFTGRLNLDDKRDTEFAAKGFLAQADSLCHNARRKKQQVEETKALRDQTAARLQKQAEQERQARAEQEKIVEDFDPLAA